jgi:L-asparaginase II
MRKTPVESAHYGFVPATSEDGRLMFFAGAPEEMVYPRSALKTFKTIAVVRAELDLPAKLLALVAAIRLGAAMHSAKLLPVIPSTAKFSCTGTFS